MYTYTYVHIHLHTQNKKRQTVTRWCIRGVCVRGGGGGAKSARGPLWACASLPALACRPFLCLPVCVCARVCLHVCVCVYMRVWCMCGVCVCTHTHMYTHKNTYTNQAAAPVQTHHEAHKSHDDSRPKRMALHRLAHKAQVCA